MEHITSPKNPKILAWRSLKERKGRLAHGSFLVEGDRMVKEALSSGFPVRALLIRGDRVRDFDPGPLPESLPCCQLSDQAFAAVSDTKTPQGVAAVLGMQPISPRGSRLLALDCVQDPGNVGTILRTADAAGLDGILLSPDCADIFAPKVLRATMGSIFRVGLSFPENLADQLNALREEGFEILSSQLDGTPFYDRPDPGEKWVLVIGNEGNGVSLPVQAAATQRLRLPMRGGAESLNAAVAAGIMMYELMKGN